VTRAALRSAGPLLATFAALLSACGNEDVVVQEAPTPLQRGVAPEAGGTVAGDPLRDGSAAASSLTITVDDLGPGRFRYRSPASVRGGLVKIRLRNIGDAPHKAQLWRITGDHTVEQALAGLRNVSERKPLPDWLLWGGGVSLTEPKKTSTTLQSLPAGRYLVSSTSDRPGEVASFEASAPARSDEVPRAPARIEMRDFKFRVSGLRAGRNSVDVDNTGATPHFSYFALMRAGTDLQDVTRFFARNTTVGKPPVDAEKTRETAVLEGGERQVAQLDLPAGRYALICFVRGRAGGPRHLELGMINEVTVK